MGRWTLGLAAGASALVLVAAAGSPMPRRGGPAPAGRETVCELERVDRGTTTAQSCLACHHGDIGPGAMFLMAPPGQQGVEHPVEVDYRQSFLHRPGQYAAPESLPPDVPLVNGKVSCTSCHDPRSPEQNHVTRPESLCIACHRL